MTLGVVTHSPDQGLMKKVLDKKRDYWVKVTHVVVNDRIDSLN